MTHDSDGELTRPYIGPPSTPVGAPRPPAMAPNQPQWTPHPVNPWPPHVPPPAPARGKALRWAVIGVSVVAVIAAALAARVTMHQAPAQAAGTEPSAESSPGANTADAPSTTASAPAVGSVSSARLPEFLPSASTLADLLVVEGLVQVADGEALYTTSTTDRPDCGGAINVGLPVAYDGSGFTAIRLQEYHDVPGQTYQYGVTEAVSAFPSDQQAQAFVSTEASRWAKCKYKSVVLVNSGSEAFSAIILPPETNAGVLSASTLNKQSSGLGCQRALKAQRNIVIDVQICSPGGSAQAPALVAQIADRIPTT
ncbi:sensor domain-containing protein [Mycobacterium sp. AZCC_0083]|uniref:sensor domain-containing protein n=1 Tax=Mycobacterium sp. AZCC_0083 TaxID=2735882 RepID=UPI001607E0CF|nr:sensor domain-containing protein [Mycobacterium sp. AZCC_0083]MBB5163548.1 hypothetical protein [Mycobacterium sp. AZCC_0083]